VPVRDRTNSVVAAIGVWGAEKNILGVRQEDLARMSVSAARDISQSLGHIEQPESKPKTRSETLEMA